MPHPRFMGLVIFKKLIKIFAWAYLSGARKRDLWVKMQRKLSQNPNLLTLQFGDNSLFL